jgi:hypothetical protein
MMKSATVYIRSFQIGSDPSADMMARDLHYYWQGENYHHVYRWWMKQAWTRGRVFEKESAALLNEIDSMSDKLEGKLDFVDLGIFPGKILGFLRGITSTPTVVLGTEKYSEYLPCLENIRRLALEGQ